MLTSKKVTISAIIVVILGILSYVGLSHNGTNVRALSGQLIEDNMPYFRNNGGTLTALPIQTSSTIQANGGVTIGSTGTSISTIQTGTCNLNQMYGTSTGAYVLGTSSALFVCPVTGVLSTDFILADLPLSAGSSTMANPVFGGWLINAVDATTSGIIGFTLYNGTGQATSSFSYATTGVEYIIIR